MSAQEQGTILNMGDSDFIAYHYVPSLAASIVFAVVFGTSTAVHLYQCFRTRAYYMLPLIVGGIGEFAGYICRIKSWTEAPDYQLTAYIVQSISILIAPAFTAATIYITFGRIMLVVKGEARSPVRQKFLTLIFVLGDLFSLVVQSNGASILTKKEPNSATVGKWVVTGGLIIQVFFFGVFMLISMVFYRRLRQSPTQHAKLIPDLWRLYLFYLYIASTLIMVRSIFRVIEYIQGDDGYLLTHQVFLYVFDSTLMSSVMLLFNIAHPTMITALLNGTRATDLLRVHTTEKLHDDISETSEASLRSVHHHEVGHVRNSSGA